MPQFHFLMQKLPWTGQTEGRQRTDRGQTKDRLRTHKTDRGQTEARQGTDRGKTKDRLRTHRTDRGLTEAPDRGQPEGRQRTDKGQTGQIRNRQN